MAAGEKQQLRIKPTSTRMQPASTNTASVPADISGTPPAAADVSAVSSQPPTQPSPVATSLSANDVAVDSLPSPFADDDQDPFSGVSVSNPPSLTLVPLHRRRRSSKISAMPAIIKRSASTPNVRGQAAADAAAMSLADKRRNKLGYHRTSIACGEFNRMSVWTRL